MELADRLRTEVALFGLRPIDVARRAGFDKSYVSRVLNGEIRPTPATITRIVLAIHADYLADERSKAAA